MDELKKHGYWIVMGVLALAAAIFYGVVVAGGAHAQIAKKTRDLKTQVGQLKNYASKADEDVAKPDGGLPVEEIVKYWEAKKTGLEAEVAEIVKMYRARDKEFEKMLGAKSDKEPPTVSDFTPPYREAVNGLRRKYAALAPEGAASEKAFPLDDPKDTDGPEKLTEYQKRFYMARAIAEAVAAKDIDAERIVEMQFKEVSGESKGKMVVRHPVEVEVVMPFANVPKLVSRLLRSNVTFDLREVKVDATPFTLPEYEPYGVFARVGPGGAAAARGDLPLKGFDKDAYMGTRDQSNPKQKGEAPELREPPVSVKISLDALDFELSESGAAPAPAGKGKKKAGE